MMQTLDNKESKHFILFVDDEEKTRKMFERIISPHYAVLMAQDVPSAIAILEERAQDIGVLLTDQRMPGQVGAELLRHARSEYPTLVRMLTTAYSDLEDAIDAVNTGEIYRYIHKPWNIDELLIDLRLAMNLYQLQCDRRQLISEKMSMSHKQSRVHLIQELLCIASSQRQPGAAEQAMSQGLKSIASALDQVEAIPQAEDAMGYWDKEVSHSKHILQAGRLIQDSLAGLACDAGDERAIDLEELKFALSSACANDTAPIVCKLSAPELDAALESASQLLGGQPLQSSYSSQDGAQIISLDAAQPAAQLAQVFTTGLVTNDAQAQAIGHWFVCLYLTKLGGGEAQLKFQSKAGNSLQAISLSFNADAAPQQAAGLDKQNYWLEDLFVLFG